jgi:hypothetical protein
MVKDRIKGSAHEAKGAIKQGAGKATGDSKLDGGCRREKRRQSSERRGQRKKMPHAKRSRNKLEQDTRNGCRSHWRCFVWSMSEIPNSTPSEIPDPQKKDDVPDIGPVPDPVIEPPGPDVPPVKEPDRHQPKRGNRDISLAGFQNSSLATRGAPQTRNAPMISRGVLSEVDF